MKKSGPGTIGRQNHPKREQTLYNNVNVLSLSGLYDRRPSQADSLVSGDASMDFCAVAIPWFPGVHMQFTDSRPCRSDQNHCKIHPQRGPAGRRVRSGVHESVDMTFTEKPTTDIGSGNRVVLDGPLQRCCRTGDKSLMEALVDVWAKKVGHPGLYWYLRAFRCLAETPSRCDGRSHHDWQSYRFMILVLRWHHNTSDKMIVNNLSGCVKTLI